MARGRMLYKKISLSKQLDDLSSDTSRLAFTWAISHLDVTGRIHGDPGILKSIVLPRRDDVSSEQMEGFIREWADVGMVIWYESAGERVVMFPGFSAHQKVYPNRETPSALPDLDEDAVLLAGEQLLEPPPDSRPTHELRMSSSRPTQDDPPRNPNPNPNPNLKSNSLSSESDNSALTEQPVDNSVDNSAPAERETGLSPSSEADPDPEPRDVYDDQHLWKLKAHCEWTERDIQQIADDEQRLGRETLNWAIRAFLTDVVPKVAEFVREKASYSYGVFHSQIAKLLEARPKQEEPGPSCQYCGVQAIQHLTDPDEEVCAACRRIVSGPRTGQAINGDARGPPP